MRAASSPARAVVPRLLLPDQRRPHARQPRRLRRHRRRRRRPDPPAHAGHDPTPATSACESSPATRGATRSSSASRRPPASPWRLSLRVPSWAHEAVLVDRGHRRPVKAGYAVVDATWKPGDEVRLELPMRPRWTRPDPHVDADPRLRRRRARPDRLLPRVDRPGGRRLPRRGPRRRVQRPRRRRRGRRPRRRDPRARVRPPLRRRRRPTSRSSRTTGDAG